jgi:hypothetical protein
MWYDCKCGLVVKEVDMGNTVISETMARFIRFLIKLFDAKDCEVIEVK